MSRFKSDIYNKSQRLAHPRAIIPVDIYWKNRSSSQRAVVIPGAEDVLLGAIPLEDMDLMVNPVNQELVGIHGDIVEHIVM